MFTRASRGARGRYFFGKRVGKKLLGEGLQGRFGGLALGGNQAGQDKKGRVGDGANA